MVTADKVNSKVTHYIALKHFHLCISHNKLEVEIAERFIVSS